MNFLKQEPERENGVRGLQRIKTKFIRKRRLPHGLIRIRFTNLKIMKNHEKMWTISG